MSTPVHVYTPREVASVLRVSDDAVLDAIKRGELRAFRVGRYWRIKAEALEAYMEGRANA